MKHTNKNAELLIVKEVGHIVTTRLLREDFKGLKITTFRRMDLPSSSGKKKGQTPTLLDPVDRAIPDLGTF
jgi:hypothetical protein